MQIYLFKTHQLTTGEDTSLKESYTEDISNEVGKQTSLKDDAKVFVKEKPFKNSLSKLKKK